MFIGRENEIKAIDYLLKTEGFKSAIIYGRRRLGKTELIKHCLESSDCIKIVYQCKESNERDNINLFTDMISQILDIKYLHFDSFIDAIEFLLKLSKDKRICLCLDEYPYIREEIAGCDSKLQYLIDNYHSESNMKFFLVGSSIDIMEEVLSNYSPLYGRFNQSILLGQMDYYDSSKFYPTFSNEDKVKLYSVFGGVPYYNAQIDKNQSVKENIIRLVSGTFSGLADYLETYLKMELRKINNANVVFDSIANGAFHFSDILSKSHVETSAALSNTLKKLIKMDLIEYVYPINDYENKQKSGYVIKDMSVKFYYRYIYRNDSLRKIFDDDIFYDEIIKDDFEHSYVPKVFETISKEFLIRKNKKMELNPILIDIGTYWYDNPKERKNGQFDVVGKTKDGYVFFECKYKNHRIDDITIEEEILQIGKTTLNPINYGFISKYGFDLKKKYDFLFYTLDDIYND